MDTETRALLQNCLDQLEALNNSGAFTRSQELRDRLRRALALPVALPACCACGQETAAALPDGTPYCGCEERDCSGLADDALIFGRGTICAENEADHYGEEPEPNPYDGTYSEI